MQRILLSAYTNQFERPNTAAECRLPKGALVTYLFNPEDPNRVRAQRSRMLRSMTEQGSEYWLIHSGQEPVALAKVTPLGEDCYFNDVAVMSERKVGVMGPYALPQLQYATPEGVTVDGIRRAFEKHLPGLASGRYFST